MALDPKKVYARFSDAKARADLWLNLLQQAYNYSMPNRSEFAIQKYTPGTARNEHVYDATAVVGLKKFAANLQNLMLPAGQHWATLKPGRLIEEGKGPVGEHQAKESCEKWEKLFFDKLEKSNFQNACYQSLMEMGISTGILLLNEGTIEDPFHFTSVPLHQVALEPGASDSVQNVYRHFKVQCHNIPSTWPKAQLGADMERRIKVDPTSEVDMIEGTIFDPEAKAPHQWAYFVMEKDSQEFMLLEYRDYSPWICFRWNVYAGEVLGRGPIVDTLPFIKDLNKLAEFDLRAASFNANPIFLVAGGSEINPFTARIEPGSIIPVQPNGISNPPVQQLTIAGQPNYSQLTREELVTAVNSALNVNPVVPMERGDKTATEINARQAEWVRENQASAGRFQTEVNQPIMEKCWRILHRMGLVPVPVIDGKHLAVEYQSPIKDLQGVMEVQKIAEASQMIQQILGPQYGEYGVMFGLDITQVPKFVCEQLNLPVDVVRDALGRQQMMKGFGQAMQAQQNAQNPNAQTFAQSTPLQTPNAGAAQPQSPGGQ